MTLLCWLGLEDEMPFSTLLGIYLTQVGAKFAQDIAIFLPFLATYGVYLNEVNTSFLTFMVPL